ncbi:MAG: PilZ domain-containing protein [Roseibium sp.]|uniref:PilZ domain-containing protein n=1 Tax=Roseibium sp. TaxID=1936156 RepID=UPI002639FF46|nr:PilZ domain-containing protein [Roseibium sp.]MCV0426327.1 PilZ domain-containing protein [Roseibium sp.]
MSDVNPAPQQNAEEEQDSEIAERDRRARVFKKGKMVFQNGLRSIPCLVRNISQGGAMLEFEQAYMLPKHFELYIDLEDYEVTCERRWEEGLRCGVEFVGEKRRIAQMRAQSLKSSEEALVKADDEFVDNANNFFNRRSDDTRRAVEPGEPLSRLRKTGGGKPSFGKRR